jgi:leucyl-tRNA synthetase
MPQWAGSCWYYLRYLDPRNPKALCDPVAERYWMGSTQPNPAKSNSNDPKPATSGVDLYVGGTEHAVLHLLYARFWHKVLYDLGHVSTPEPFFKLVNQGLILGGDGQKMSKSCGNVINPDLILNEYGADAFRLYEMFMGPLEMVKPWNTKGVEGVYRFLGRVWRLFVDETSETQFEQNCTAHPDRAAEFLSAILPHPAIGEIEPDRAQLKALHACIRKVTDDLDHLRFNTAISALMIFVNEAMTWPNRPAPVLRPFLVLLHPFAPHLAEDLWNRLPGRDDRATIKDTITPPSTTSLSQTETLPSTDQTAASTLAYQPWPTFDPALLVEDTLEIPVQVNGKLRDRIRVPADATRADLETAARAAERVQPFLEGLTIRKVIVVPGKLVNLVASAT